MAEKKKSSSSKNGKGKQSSSNQKSLLDLFPRKQKPVTEPANANNDHTEVGTSKESDAGDRQTLAQDLPALADTSSPLLPPHSSSPLPATLSSLPHEVDEPEREIIDIPDSPVKTHSSESPEVLTVSLPGSQKNNPIVVDSSPVRLTTNPKKKGGNTSTAKKEVYSIFAPRVPKANVSLPASPSKSSVPGTSTVEKEAPYPTEDMQHVRGQQSEFPTDPSVAPPARQCLQTSSETNPVNSNTPLQHFISADADPSEPSPNEPSLRVHSSTSPSDRATHLTRNIPTSHRLHPSISHLISIATDADLLVESGTNRLWTEKWRPTRAEHVLHNEDHAVYLRDWLSALELQFDAASGKSDDQEKQKKVKPNGKAKTSGAKGVKRQRVVRAVEKPARKKRRIDSDDEDLDGWIVPDDFADEEMLSDGEDDLFLRDDNADYHPPRLFRRGSPDRTDSITEFSGYRKLLPKYTFKDRLTNTILLTGPSGSGKTAAVYACAEELGWEVFEVYPGIGKRNAANLDNLVGEVGKNHLVRKARGKEPNVYDSSIKSLFLRKQHADDGHQVGAQPADVETINNRFRSPSTDFGFVEQLAEAEATEVNTQFRQSLILLEEVDILYRDDTSFWPAVINLIKDCKRPVICTCNDLSLVPISDLPLQDIRVFESCPAPVANSYLQALCCAEGYIAEADSLSMLCQMNARYRESQRDHCLDLRQAISHLQLWCPVNEDAKAPHTEQSVTCTFMPEELEDQIEQVDWNVPNVPPERNSQGPAYTRRDHADLLSFADCHLMRSPNDTLTGRYACTSMDDMQPTADDVTGHRMLLNPETSNPRGFFGHNLYDRDEMIMSSAIAVSRGKMSGIGYCGARVLAKPRVDYETFVREIGNNRAVSVHESLLRRQVFDLDYLPLIREMIRADDETESAEKAEGMYWVGGRRTRNSQKQQHVRTIEVSQGERRGLIRSELGGGVVDIAVI